MPKAGRCLAAPLQGKVGAKGLSKDDRLRRGSWRRDGAWTRCREALVGSHGRSHRAFIEPSRAFRTPSGNLRATFRVSRRRGAPRRGGPSHDDHPSNSPARRPIVTGGGAGIGFAIARAFARAGAQRRHRRPNGETLAHSAALIEEMGGARARRSSRRRLRGRLRANRRLDGRALRRGRHSRQQRRAFRAPAR